MSQYFEFIKVADSILDPLGWKVSSCDIIQTLWAGYGQICRLQALKTNPGRDSDKPKSLILKYVAPPRSKLKSDQDEGHLRKVISYQVEQHFYVNLVPTMPTEIGVAHCWGRVHEQDCMAMILDDLHEDYPIVPSHRGELSKNQVHAALKWLATFHGHWWKRRNQFQMDDLRRPPLDEVKLLQANFSRRTEGVWLNGGYTYVNNRLNATSHISSTVLTRIRYLATRRAEYDHLKMDKDSSWAVTLCKTDSSTKDSIAELVAAILAPSSGSSTAQYHTLIHGDVKSENLFSSMSHTEVAFFDFQYVGLGLGVCDLAKLFTCSVPIDMLTVQDIGGVAEMGTGERQLLQQYRDVIREVSGIPYDWNTLEMHWNTALVDWLRFQASWGFWGNTDWLEARVRHIQDDENWRAWVLAATQETSQTS
nr:hypothetical protein CFP56_04626 [Quercus suber]